MRRAGAFVFFSKKTLVIIPLFRLPVGFLACLIRSSIGLSYRRIVLYRVIKITLNAFEWQDPPGRLQHGYVDESYRVGNDSSVDDVYQTYDRRTIAVSQ